MHNDNVNSVEFVSAALRDIFKLDEEQINECILTIQEHDKAVITTGCLEHLEFLKEQVEEMYWKPKYLKLTNTLSKLNITLEKLEDA